ncbi:MAG: cytochrome c biogenesis protein CcsA [Verrucomicrobiota bacterium]
MEVLDHRWAFWLAGIWYFFAFVFAILSLGAKRRYSRPWMLVLMLGGMTFQTWGLWLRGQDFGGCPLGNPFELLQFVSWSAVLLYFLIGPAFRMSLLGLFSAALAAFLGLGSLLNPLWDAPYKIRLFGTHPVVEAHASLAVFSYGVFGVLALVALMYFFQYYGLKQGKSTGIFAYLPSIVQLDQIAVRLLWVGLAVLSFSLVFGFRLYSDDQITTPVSKLIITLAVWGGYGALSVLKWRGVCVGKRFAAACIILFVMAIVSLWPVDAGRQLANNNGEDLRTVCG